jgi:hypothetical protein
MSKPLGSIFYRGPSTLTGQRIVGVLTYQSNNTKTGNMAQTWILPDGARTRIDPSYAVKTGADRAVCGDCPLRGPSIGQRACYVVLAHGPASVGRALTAGRYSPWADDHAPLDVPVRLGAYGDPAAIPFEAWIPVLSAARSWTGYTHQWRTCDRRWQGYLMASVETERDADIAQLAGWRTFRVGTRSAGPLLPADPPRPGEVVCPASAEAGYKQTCARCRLCSGNTGRGATSGARNVVIAPHGGGVRYLVGGGA